jgi:hypothetical protein
MFHLSSEINIGNLKKLNPSAVKWRCSVSNFTDTCTISIPLRPYVKNDSQNKTAFQEGDKVEVRLGYNDRNKLVFKGFIRRVNFAKPLMLDCEGYSYPLKDIVFTKSYVKTTIKQILSDLTKDTGILLSQMIPDVTLKNVTFSKTPGLKVLEWFKKECACTVFFDFDYLYVGASKFAIQKKTEKLLIGWNTVEEKELKKDISDIEIQINITEKSDDGSHKNTLGKVNKKNGKWIYTTTKQVKVRSGLPESFRREIAKELAALENFSGYKGNVMAFLEPHFEKSMVAEIIDKDYPDRNGKYFIEQVDGAYGVGGGRQKLTLRYYDE